MTSRSIIGYGVTLITPFSNKTHIINNNKFLSSNYSSLLCVTNKFGNIQNNRLKYNNNSNILPPIFAIQSNFLKVAKSVFKIGKDGVEAGTNLVPDSVPRPVARISVTAVAAALALFVLKSFVSTVFFALGVMGFVYFVYIALNKDKGTTRVDEKPGSTVEAIEQAQKIMDKYK